MKRFFIAALAAFLAGVFGITLAQQSNPGFTYGQTPSAAQWNSYFSGKLDYAPGGLPIMYGGTGATTAQGALNNIAGAVANGLYLRGNGTAVVPSAIQAGDVPGLAGGLLGSIPYQSTVSTSTFLAGNTSTVPSFLTSTGNGSTALAPSYTTSTGSGSVVLATSPTINTATIANPSISGGTIASATITGSSINGNTVTTGAGTLTLSGKTLVTSNSLTLAGTDGTTMTFPSTSASIARIDASQTFSGTQTFSGVLTGTATVNLQASPGPIGSVAPNTGAFTTLSASSTVSGAGFSTYLASPPAIGGTVANSVKATTVTASTSYSLTNLLVSATTPTLSSCGTSTVTSSNGSAAFRITVAGVPSACTINLPTAANGWNCYATDVTTTANAWMLKQTGTSTTSATITNYNAGSTQALTNADVLAVSCFAY
jgi:hypothetical protein